MTFRKSFILSCCFLITTNAHAQSSSTNYLAQRISNYTKITKASPSFVPLEIGQITPKGWLLDWAKTAANGITGHLDEYNDVFKHGWKGYGFEARGVNKDGTGWPLEQCSYWLDGAVKLAYILNDSSLKAKTSSRLNLVVDGVLNGSETFIYWKPKSIVNNTFNNWGHALMGRALVSYYQATHDPKILQALVNVYSHYNLLVPKAKEISILDKGMFTMRGATNIDPMIETYLMSGKKEIVDTILTYSQKKEIRDFEANWLQFDARKTVQPNEGVHAVTFYEVIKVPALMYLLTGNKMELKASQNLLKWGEDLNIQPYGVCSSEEYLAGKGSFRNTETCNVPTSMWSFLWMLRITGNSNWGDKVENVFFNAAPAPVDRDFKTMCYYQAPNRFSSKLPGDAPVPGEGSQLFTNHGHEVLCCVGNINNSIPNYISNMWMGTMDNGLAATLYGPCSVNTVVNNNNVNIDCSTNYPFDDKIEIIFKLSKAVNMPVYLRIPDWCKHPSIRINGKITDCSQQNGFVKIARAWKNNDKIVLVLPMSIQVHQGRENTYPKIPYYINGFRGSTSTLAAKDSTINNPFETVTYGPLLFSLPIKDINPNQEDANVKYNYALNVRTDQPEKDIKVVKKKQVGEWKWEIEDAPIVLNVKATEINWVPDQLHPLPTTPVKAGKDTRINLVPYGLTKFRVTLFPVTRETWNSK